MATSITWGALGGAAAVPVYWWSTSQERPALFDASCSLLVSSLHQQVQRRMRIVTRGPCCVVALYNGDVVATQAAANVQVVDPTGAGDCFASGFLYGFRVRASA